MSNAIAKVDETSVMTRYSPEQVDLIRSQVAPNATDDELKLFLYVAKQRGLDPLAKQIYCIHRGGKMTIQTSIDGFRSIAERTGTYAPGAESWVDNEKGLPVSATVSVRKLVAGTWIEFSATAHTSEYNAGGSMWGKMAHVMIAKCAEAKVLRKGWPEQLGGLYTQDEMEQSSLDAIPQERPAAVVREIREAPKERPAQKASEALPESFGPHMALPPAILLACKAIQNLTGAVQDMATDDLELLIEQMDRLHAHRKSSNNTSAHGLRIIQEIAAAAQLVIDRRNNGSDAS